MRLSRRERRWRVGMVVALLLAAQFYLRPWFGSRVAPDFLLLAMMLLAIRSRPGVAAIIGFLTGLLSDVLTPARFGAGALSHTVVGYLAAWGRALFFPDNLLVNAVLFAAGVWARNLIVLLASGTPTADLGPSLLIWSPLQAISTAVAGIVVVLLFREWLAIRLDE